MASEIATNSYGSKAGVAARAPRWVNASGGWDATTTPTEAQVVDFIDEVSALVNAHLAEYGFDVPVDQEDAKKIFDMFVNDEVASIVLGLHGSGRFAPKAGKSAGTGESRFVTILRDLESFLKTHQYGLAQLGVDGSGSLSGIYSSYDEDIEPLIDRDYLFFDES